MGDELAPGDRATTSHPSHLTDPLTDGITDDITDDSTDGPIDHDA